MHLLDSLPSLLHVLGELAARFAPAFGLALIGFAFWRAAQPSALFRPSSPRRGSGGQGPDGEGEGRSSSGSGEAGATGVPHPRRLFPFAFIPLWFSQALKRSRSMRHVLPAVGRTVFMMVIWSEQWLQWLKSRAPPV